MRALLLVVLALLAGQGALASDIPMPLKAGPGDDVTNAYCNACHTSNYIIMNSVFLTPEQWKAEVSKMRSGYGAPIDDATAAAITVYLSAQYAAKP
jgi:hypothetical protein